MLVRSTATRPLLPLIWPVEPTLPLPYLFERVRLRGQRHRRGAQRPESRMPGLWRSGPALLWRGREPNVFQRTGMLAT
jgi:hypothetical protein